MTPLMQFARLLAIGIICAGGVIVMGAIVAVVELRERMRK